MPHASGSRKGQSLISLLLFTGIVLIGVGTVITVTGPVLDNLQDSAAIDGAQDILSGLQDQVERVADGGEGSRIGTTVSFGRGTLLVDADADEIAYEVDTGAEIIPPHTSEEIGNLLLSAMATTTVTKVEVDGQDCWRMENEHVQVCIRDVSEPGDMIGTDTVGFWRFTPGGGQVVVDNSSHGNNGTLGSSDVSEASDPSRTGGLRGNGLDFDGNDDFVDITSPDLSLSDQITVTAWMKPSTISGDNRQWIVEAGDDAFMSYLASSDSDLQFRVDAGGSETTWDTGHTISTDTWQHVALVYNGSYMTAYVDGASAGTNPKSGDLASTGDVQLGGDAGDDGDWYNGMLDEVRVYNRSLTKEEVQYQYNTSGYLDYIDTRDLLLEYRNKDEGTNLSQDFHVKINTGLDDGSEDDAFTMNGTGTVTPAITGDHLGRGRLTAEIESFYGIDYNIIFQLFSDSDFLHVNVEE